jgi:hypothetical protein
MNIVDETHGLNIELEDWKGAEARLWDFTASHNRLVYKLTKSSAGRKVYGYLVFAGCEEISTPTDTDLAEVEHFNIDSHLKCFRSGKISIVHEWWSLQQSEP